MGVCMLYETVWARALFVWAWARRVVMLVPVLVLGGRGRVGRGSSVIGQLGVYWLIGLSVCPSVSSRRPPGCQAAAGTSRKQPQNPRHLCHSPCRRDTLAAIRQTAQWLGQECTHASNQTRCKMQMHHVMLFLASRATWARGLVTATTSLLPTPSPLALLFKFMSIAPSSFVLAIFFFSTFTLTFTFTPRPRRASSNRSSASRWLAIS
jgi:hypothetical protein